MSPHSSFLRLDDIKFGSKKVIPKIILGIIVFALVTFGGANLLNAAIGSVNAVEGEEEDTAIVVPEEGGEGEEGDEEEDEPEEDGKKDEEEDEEGDESSPEDDEKEPIDPPAAEDEDTNINTNAIIADAIYQSLDHLPKNGVDHSLDRALSASAGEATSNIPALRTLRADNLPAYYNSREQAFASQIRTKNQNTEGICWAYSGATVLEYALAKRGIYTTVSPKHVDYQMVAASDAYKASDVAAGATNLYNDRTVAALQASDVATPQRKLGGGGNELHIIMTWTNPLSIMSET
ncbi:hypothetical protein IIZ77_01900, partial [Candidatus Saccharibacteria bacterium]|nr:hypothetical protein [Candidatus Saccharibacteria bacterium]